MTQKDFDYIKGIWNLIKQTKGHEFYLDRMIKLYTNTERNFQVFIAISTIISLIVLSRDILDTNWNNVVICLTLLAQILTLLYPYLFKFNEKIIKLTLLKKDISVLYNKYHIVYIEISIKKEHEIKQIYQMFFDEHEQISSQFTEKHLIKHFDEKYKKQSVDDALKFLKVYF